jgi:transcriptional regulator with XRE-family HTH domain
MLVKNSPVAIFEALMRNSFPLTTVDQLGRFVREIRKSQGLRQDEVGRLSHTFMGELESGKPTAQIGKVFEALRELGIQLYIAEPGGKARTDT